MLAEGKLNYCMQYLKEIKNSYAWTSKNAIPPVPYDDKYDRTLPEVPVVEFDNQGIPMPPYNVVIFAFTFFKADQLIDLNAGLQSADGFYKTRQYRRTVLKFKLQVSPVQITDVFMSNIFQKYVPYKCQSSFFIFYHTKARKEYDTVMKDVINKPPRTNLFDDRHISMEPEMRSLMRFKNLEPYEAAKERYDDYHKTKTLDKVLTRQHYDAASALINTEINEIVSYGEYFTFEWPTARASYITFAETMGMSFLIPQQFYAGSADFLKRMSYVADTDPDGADALAWQSNSEFILSQFEFNYTLSVKQILQKTLNTPIFDRVQFSKGTKYTTYTVMDQAGAMLRSKSNRVINTSNIGLIIKKRRRLMLQSMLNQTKLTERMFEIPVVQMALRFFSVLDSTSLNLRRMITFAIYTGVSTSIDSTMLEHILSPIKYTSMTRYDAMRSNDLSAGDRLEKWHLGYKLLAESHIRRRVQKTTKKLFRMMRSNHRAIEHVMSTMTHKDYDNEVYTGQIPKINRNMFVQTMNPELSIFSTFILTMLCAAQPPFLTSSTKFRGFTGTHYDNTDKAITIIMSVIKS